MKVLIIVDMLNGFCRRGYPLSLPGSTADIEKHILSRGEEILKENGKVVFVCDSHLMTDPEIGNPYPPHCMKGTAEAEIVDELKPLANNATVLTKNTLSIFLNTQLEKILKELNPEIVEVAGVCTDICDLFAVYELRVRGYNVFVSPKGVLPLDPDKQHEYLDYFKNRLGARVE
ncbi:MAG TPA: isochorismatase family cysteine hydrolase [Chitinophagaceae bacterium]|jgi:nicotinamidase-related amidase